MKDEPKPLRVSMVRCGVGSGSGVVPVQHRQERRRAQQISLHALHAPEMRCFQDHVVRAGPDDAACISPACWDAHRSAASAPVPRPDGCASPQHMCRLLYFMLYDTID